MWWLDRLDTTLRNEGLDGVRCIYTSIDAASIASLKRTMQRRSMSAPFPRRSGSFFAFHVSIARAKERQAFHVTKRSRKRSTTVRTFEWEGDRSQGRKKKEPSCEGDRIRTRSSNPKAIRPKLRGSKARHLFSSTSSTSCGPGPTVRFATSWNPRGDPNGAPNLLGACTTDRLSSVEPSLDRNELERKR